jgi:hypothetical protein
MPKTDQYLTRIADSAILTAEAVFGKNKPIRRTWGLEPLCLGLRIRGCSASSYRVPEVGGHEGRCGWNLPRDVGADPFRGW